MITVVSHFYNEEFLLPHWLYHHAKIFDHGVLIDYGSTDKSCEIIRKMVPTWDIVKSRFDTFFGAILDQEVMEIEEKLYGWKMCLNITEFLLISKELISNNVISNSDLKQYLNNFEAEHPTYLGLKVQGISLWDRESEKNTVLNNDKPLFLQKTYGLLVDDRSRLLHKASNGNYHPGRHDTYLAPILQREPKLFCVHFGSEGLLAQKILRNSSDQFVKLDKRDTGVHSYSTEQIIKEYNTSERRKLSFDLLSYPPYKSAVDNANYNCKDLTTTVKPIRKKYNLILVAHFRNEEFLLPHWLYHHSRIFDHGVLIDYGSTDKSCEIIRKMVPSWQIIKSRFNIFYDKMIEVEVEEIEQQFDGWKMCLNIPEFLLVSKHLHSNGIVADNIRTYLKNFEIEHPTYLGLRVEGITLWDKEEDKNIPLNNNKSLFLQKTHGLYATDRRRLLHKAIHGHYQTGRHDTNLTPILQKESNLFCVHFGSEGLLAQKILRNTTVYNPAMIHDKQSNHIVSPAELERRYYTDKRRERSFDLLTNSSYASAVENANYDVDYNNLPSRPAWYSNAFKCP